MPHGAGAAQRRRRGCSIRTCNTHASLKPFVIGDTDSLENQKKFAGSSSMCGDGAGEEERDSCRCGAGGRGPGAGGRLR